MNQFLHVGGLDGESMIEMNNVAVGYLTQQKPEFCAYSPLTPVQVVSVEMATLVPPAGLASEVKPA